MASVLDILRSLGPSGATANARVLLDERRREERVVEAVARQLAPSGDASPRVA